MKFPTFCMPNGCLTDIFKKLCCITDDASSPHSASTLQSTAARDVTECRRDFSKTGSSGRAMEKKTRTRLATLLRTHPTSNNAPTASLDAPSTTIESQEIRAFAAAPSPPASPTLALPTSPATKAAQGVTTKRRQNEAALYRSVANRPRRKVTPDSQINASATKQESDRPLLHRKSAHSADKKSNGAKKMDNGKAPATKSTTGGNALPPLQRPRFSTNSKKEFTMPSGLDAHSGWMVGGNAHTAQQTPQAAAGQRVERASSKRMQSAIAR